MDISRYRRHLNWILLTGCCVTFVVCRILERWAAHEQGLQLGMLGAFSAMIETSLILLSMLSAFVFSGLLLLQIFVRRSLPKGFLSIFALPPIAWKLPAQFKIPSYMDGIRSRLRDSPSLPRFVETAAAEVAKVKPDDRTSYHIDRERGEELFSKEPFKSVGFKFPPRAFVLSRSLVLNWGGSLSFRWGMTISSEKGAPPELPRDARKYFQLSPEIILYTVPGA